jgi:septum formation protein
MEGGDGRISRLGVAAGDDALYLRRLDHLILASGSPRRREQLGELGIPFEVRVSDVDEEEVVANARPESPGEIVTLLAEAKARAIARQTQEQALVIGADTIVWLDNQALNKPKDADDAVRMLMSLAGRTHSVYTGIAIISAGECVLRPALTAFEVTGVTFTAFSEPDARAYVATGEPMDKAGAYGIQDGNFGRRFVASIDGDFNNVVGLPVELLRRLLRAYA